MTLTPVFITLFQGNQRGKQGDNLNTVGKLRNDKFPFSFQNKERVNVGIRAPYVRVIGLEVDTVGPGRSTGIPLAPTEEEEFRHMAANPNIYEVIAKSIAPSIYGSLDIKKAIACLLFGGSRKRFIFSCVLKRKTVLDQWRKRTLSLYW